MQVEARGEAAMNNAEIATTFYELADLLELGGAPAFRVRAFRTAARSIENLAEPCAERLRDGTLTDVPGIGEGCARRVGELLATGRLAELDELRAKTPRGLSEIMHVEGMGPKSAELVWERLHVRTIEELEAAARAGRLRGLPRFGEKKEQKVLRAISAYRRAHARWKVSQAHPHADTLVAELRALPHVERVEPCGTLRRRRDTVGDIDILVAATPAHAAAIGQAFASLPEVREVIARGDTKVSVVLRAGIHADLRIVEPASWGAALHYFTGSRDHNIAVRRLAQRRGLKLNEYGIWDEEGRRVGGADEREVFRAVGLAYIEPELRENRGELEAAAEGRLPRLVRLDEIRGDLHMHTKATDGKSSLEEMVRAAAAIGYEYLAITDHSRALAMARGLDPARLAEQGRAIEALNEELGGRPRVLRGIEVDILPDGTLNLPLEVLRALDWVVASVHSKLDLPGAEQTRRIVRALETGVVDCLGHPTGRLIGEREPYAVDLEEVCRAARRTGAAVEINAFPDRLDLCDTHARLAKELGVPVAISTDSHATTHLHSMRFGVDQARRGWLERGDVANTLPLERLQARFAPHHRRVTAAPSRRPARRSSPGARPR
jgi:DNA polymerase (family 10)